MEREEKGKEALPYVLFTI